MIAQHYDWHMLFWFATGLGVAALVMFVFLVPHVPSRTDDGSIRWVRCCSRVVW